MCGSNNQNLQLKVIERLPSDFAFVVAKVSIATIWFKVFDVETKNLVDLYKMFF